MFIEAFSIAIWNKNKLITGIAVAVWMTNVGVIIQGKVPSPYRLSYLIRTQFLYQVSCG